MTLEECSEGLRVSRSVDHEPVHNLRWIISRRTRKHTSERKKTDITERTTQKSEQTDTNETSISQHQIQTNDRTNAHQTSNQTLHLRFRGSPRLYPQIGGSLVTCAGHTKIWYTPKQTTSSFPSPYRTRLAPSCEYNAPAGTDSVSTRE